MTIQRDLRIRAVGHMDREKQLRALRRQIQRVRQVIEAQASPGDDASRAQAIQDIAAALDSSEPRYRRWFAGAATMFGDSATPLAVVAALITGALALVGVDGDGALGVLAREAPLALGAAVAAILVLWLVGLTFRDKRGSATYLIAVVITVTLAFIVLTATWVPTAATAPRLKLTAPETETGQYTVAAAADRLQGDERMRVFVKVIDRPSACAFVTGGAALVSDEGMVTRGAVGPEGAGSALYEQNLPRQALEGSGQYLCLLAYVPDRCGWRLGQSLEGGGDNGRTSRGGRCAFISPRQPIRSGYALLRLTRRSTSTSESHG